MHEPQMHFHFTGMLRFFVKQREGKYSKLIYYYTAPISNTRFTWKAYISTDKYHRTFLLRVCIYIIGILVTFCFTKLEK